MFGRAGPRLEGHLVLTAQREESLSHTEVSTHTGIHIPELQAHHSQSAMNLSTSFPLFTLLLMPNFNFSLLVMCPKSLFRTASQPRRDLHRTSEPRQSLHSHHFATQSNCSCMPSTFFHSLASRLFLVLSSGGLSPWSRWRGLVLVRGSQEPAKGHRCGWPRGPLGMVGDPRPVHPSAESATSIARSFQLVYLRGLDESSCGSGHSIAAPWLYGVGGLLINIRTDYVASPCACCHCCDG